MAAPGLIPEDILQEIMARCDIVELVGEYVPLRQRGRNWFGLCPFHSEDTPSFSVNRDKQLFKCFGCGKGGNAITFVAELEHMSFGEAARKLAARCGVTIPETAASPEELRRRQERQSLLLLHEEAAAFFREQLPASKAAQAYLQRRGISGAMAERFGLGFSPEEDWQALHHQLEKAGYGQEIQLLSGLVSKSGKTGRCYDKFHGRLIFPIRDQRGRAVAFGGRIIGEGEPKYLNSQTTPIYNKSQILFGLHLAADAISRHKQAVIMEGYMDVLTAHQYGVENAVASLGTAFTDQQARLLQRLAPPPPERLQVILAFDGDAAGDKAALASLEKIDSLPWAEARVMLFPEGLDPDDFLRKYAERGGWQRLLERHCLPGLDYLLLRSLKRHDIATAAGKGQVVADMLPALAKVKSATERDSFISQMARQLGVDEGSIRSDLARGGRPAPAAPARRAPVQTREERELTELLSIALSDREAFALVWSRRQEAPWSGPAEELLELAHSLGESYDFRQGSLFNYLNEENEGLREFLLKLISTDIPEGDKARVAGEYLDSLTRRAVDRRLAELQRQITAAEAQGQDAGALVRQRLRLMQEKKGL